MFDHLLSLLRLGKWAKTLERSRLVTRYPNHLDLIDSREIPLDSARCPNLSYYSESAQYYYELIVKSAPYLKDKPRAKGPVTDAEREMASVANNRIVNAGWGLIARGAEAVPYAVRLIRSADRDQREAAANVFCGLRDPQRLPEIVSQITSAIQTESDRPVVDSLLAALGNLRSRDAIPVIARFILNQSEDSDTRHTAAVSLGQIVKIRFDKRGANTIQMAYEWLAAHGYARPYGSGGRNSRRSCD
jgi:hypothetical protein